MGTRPMVILDENIDARFRDFVGLRGLLEYLVNLIPKYEKLTIPCDFHSGRT